MAEKLAQLIIEQKTTYLRAIQVYGRYTEEIKRNLTEKGHPELIIEEV